MESFVWHGGKAWPQPVHRCSLLEVVPHEQQEEGEGSHIYPDSQQQNTWQWRGLNHLSHLVSYNLLSLHKEIYSCNQNIDSGLFNYRSNPKEAVTLFHKSLFNWSKDRGGRPDKTSLPFTSLPLSNGTAKTKDQNQHYERVINASITREQKCKGFHHNSE